MLAHAGVAGFCAHVARGRAVEHHGHDTGERALAAQVLRGVLLYNDTVMTLSLYGNVIVCKTSLSVPAPVLELFSAPN